MADSNDKSNEDGATVATGDQQTLQDLQATIAKLQAENASLRSSNKPSFSNTAATQFVDNLTQGITQGISQAISTQFKNPPSKNKLKKQLDSVEVDPDLPQCYHDLQHQQKTDNVGPPISKNISEVLDRCWHYPFRKDEIVDVLDKQVRPQNINAVKPLEKNPEVKVRMTKSDRANEKDLRCIGNAICSAGKCLSYLMDMLTQEEIQLKSEFPDDEGWLIVDNFSFDFPKANKLMTNAMKILGMANVQTSQARRSMLAPKFKQEFRRLCDKSNGFEDGMFFGPSLDAVTALLSDENKVQTKTFEQKSSFRGRGRAGRKWGRNRSSPYQSSSQSSQL